MRTWRLFIYKMFRSLRVFGKSVEFPETPQTGGGRDIKMDRKAIEREITAMLANQFKSRGLRIKVSRATPLISAGLLDSLTAVELVADLEKMFKIIILPEEMSEDNFDGIDKMVNYVIRKKEEVR
jgi:acyl carrier protein